MANSLNMNPMYVDTAATIKATGNLLNLKAVAWLNDEASGKDIASGDDFLITDGAAKRIIGKRAVAAGDELMFTFPANFVVDGLIISVVDGGVLYLYF